MTASQIVFSLITINLLMIAAGVVINNQEIDDYETLLENKLSTQMVAWDADFSKVEQSGFFSIPFINDIAVGISSAINLVGLGFIIIGLFVGNYLKPFEFILFAEGESILVLKVIGYLGILYFWWFNIHSSITLYKLMKGSGS